MGVQMRQGLMQCREITRVQLQMRHYQLQAVTFCGLFYRQALEQPRDLTEVTFGE
ncbi:hypothetical protein D3C81_2223750 [compost metagenome]